MKVNIVLSMKWLNINSCALSTEGLQLTCGVCACVCVAVYWCMILLLRGYLQYLRKAGRNLLVSIFVSLFLSLCVCVCLCVFGAPHSQIAAQAGSLLSGEAEE